MEAHEKGLLHRAFICFLLCKNKENYVCNKERAEIPISLLLWTNHVAVISVWETSNIQEEKEGYKKNGF